MLHPELLKDPRTARLTKDIVQKSHEIVKQLERPIFQLSPLLICAKSYMTIGKQMEATILLQKVLKIGNAKDDSISVQFAKCLLSQILL